VWNEGRCTEGRLIPRGYIIHVLSEQRMPVARLEDIVDFIEAYLRDPDNGPAGGRT
jgi:hypothetical protein